MILRNLARRRSRSLLSILGVALSIGATVALLGVSKGLVGEISEVASGAGSELTVVQRFPEGLTFGYVGTVPGALVSELRGLRGIAGVSPLLLIPATISREAVFVIYGVSRDSPDLARARVVAGRGLGPGEVRSLLLGQRAAEGMGKRVGDSLTVLGKTLRIVGIYRSGLPLEDGGGIMDLGAARELFGVGDRVSLIRVTVASPRQAGAVRRAIEARFPDVAVLTPDAFARDRLNLEAAVQAAWAVSGIALLLSVLTVANTMAMAVLERTREIGILLAVGWSRARIVGLVLGEALVLSAAGGLAGIGVGVGALRALNAVYTLLPFPEEVAGTLLIRAFLLALGVGVFGGLLPALRASRLDPVEALRAL